MYIGELTSIQAAKAGLWRLTASEAADAPLTRTYTHPERLTETIRYKEWCEAEAKRIGADPRRTAAVVVIKRTMCAVHVNRIAGEGQDDGDDE